MTSHRKETDTLPVILGQHLPAVGAKVCGNTERNGRKRWVRPSLLMVLNLKLKGLGFVSYGGKRLGTESKDLGSDSGSATCRPAMFLEQTKF